MRTTKIISTIVNLVIIILTTFSMDTTAQRVGSILKFKNYKLNSFYLKIDTIGYYMMESDINGIQIFRNDSINKKKSDVDIRVTFTKDSLPSVYFGEELFITTNVENYNYCISLQNYHITKIDIVSQNDSHYDRSLFILDDYGLLIDDSNIWDTHLRFLPLQIDVASRYSKLCDEIMKNEIFNKYKISEEKNYLDSIKNSIIKQKNESEMDSLIEISKKKMIDKIFEK